MCLNKLGQLEDIEEELGIDLITLFKALKQMNLFCKIKKYEGKEMIVPCKVSQIGKKDGGAKELEKAILVYYVVSDSYCDSGFRELNKNLYFKDYGKTWALAREELE